MKKIAIKAALEGGKVLMHYFHNGTKIKNKTDRDIVTEADIKSEKKILSILMKSFPKHNYCSEECSDKHNKSNYTWIIDPLDGTVNFASKNPLFAISIGLKYKEEIVLSVIYLPVFNELFVAEKGKGATLNNKKIYVSNKSKLKESISSVSAGIKTLEKMKFSVKIFSSIGPNSRSMLILGSTPLALAFLSCGRIENYLAYKSDVYNMAAGYLLVKEAGGKVTDYNGKEFNLDSKKLNVIASNGKIHKVLLDIIKK